MALTVGDLLTKLENYTANLDVCVQVDGGEMDFELTIEEYPANSPTEVRITANGDTNKSQVDDVITELEALTANLPVMARVADGPWADVIAAITIPDNEEGTDVLIVAVMEDID